MPLKDLWSGPAATYSGLGFTIAGSVLGMFFLGWWIDGMTGTKPLLAIVGAFIGMAGGFINLVRTLNQLQKEQEQKKNEATDE